MCLGITGVLVLAGPLLAVAAAVVGLSSHGPLGALGAVGLVLGLLLVARAAAVRGRRWWAGTRGRWPH